MNGPQARHQRERIPCEFCAFCGKKLFPISLRLLISDLSLPLGLPSLSPIPITDPLTAFSLQPFSHEHTRTRSPSRSTGSSAQHRNKPERNTILP